MGIRNIVKRGVSGGFSPTRWMSVESIKENGHFIGELFQAVFYRKKSKNEALQKKSFEEVMQHFKMTEKDLEMRMRKSRLLILFCLGLGILVLGYMAYLYIDGQLLAGTICLMLSFVMFSYAFREHFNLFQMKQRRLGCTFKEWFNSLSRKGQ